MLSFHPNRSPLYIQLAFYSANNNLLCVTKLVTKTLISTDSLNRELYKIIWSLYASFFAFSGIIPVKLKYMESEALLLYQWFTHLSFHVRFKRSLGFDFTNSLLQNKTLDQSKLKSFVGDTKKHDSD